MMILPAKSPFLERWFRAYTRRYLQRSFHAVHLLGELPHFNDDGHTPLVVCLNHSSWWDVLLGFFVATDIIGWEFYGVMDARQLQRYRFFSRLGVIGVDRTGIAGTKEFLRFCETLLRGKRRALYLTPQGEMLSNLARPLRFQPGLGHLATLLGDFYVLTITLHYEFWNERLPEAFLSISPPEYIHAADGFDRKAFVRTQERRMEAQLDTLFASAQRRDAAAFQPLLCGKTGISPIYDAIRSAAARLRGERFTPEHSAIITPQWKKNFEPPRHRDT